MKLFGHCPACEARIDFGASQPALHGVCAACGARYMVGVPAETSEAEEQELALLPAPARPSWLAERGLERPLRYALFAGALLFALTFALGLASLLSPVAAENALTALVSLVAWPLLLVVVTLPFSALAVRWFVARGARDGARSYWWSVVAVSAGAATLGCGAVLLPRGVGLVLGVGWSAAILSSLVAGGLAGLVTMRLAPRQPYRHALAAGIVLALGLALLMTPFGWEFAVGALAYTLYAPLLLLGAWLGTRFRPAAGAA